MYGASSHGSAPFGSKSSRGRAPRFFTYASVLYAAVSLSGFLKNFSRALTAGMSLAGTRLKSIQRSVYAGTLHFGTTIVKKASRTLSGVLALTSYVKRAVVHFLGGAVTLVTTFVPSKTKAFLATLTLTGTNKRIAIRKLVATLHLSGINIKNRRVFHNAALSVGAIFFRYKTILTTGILGFGGAVSRVVNEKHFNVTLNFSTNFSRAYERVWNATMTLVASLTGRSRNFQAMLTVQASYLRRFFMSADASLTMTTQNAIKNVAKFFNSIFSLASLSRIDRIRFVQMSLTFASTLKKNVSRVVATSLTVTVTGLTHLLNKLFTGTLTVASVPIRRTRSLAGVLAPLVVSSLKNVFRRMTTTLRMTGSGFKTVKRTMTMLFHVAGTFINNDSRRLVGTLSFLVSMKKNVGKKVQMAVHLVASEKKNVRHFFTVTFRVAAALFESYNKKLVAALSVVVRFVRSPWKFMTGELFVGTTFIRYPLTNSLVLEWYSTYQAQSYNIYYSLSPHNQGILVYNTTSTYMALPVGTTDYDIVARHEKPTVYVSPFVKGVGWFAVYPVVDGLERECLIRKAVKV